jgi:putative polyketide hydroxylase
MGQPGTRAAHVVLERQGKSHSTLDLFGSHFVLLVGPNGQNWLDAARRTIDVLHHLPLDVYRIGGEAGDFIDAGSTFCDTYGITPTGAVIVRPDGFIGWRSQGVGENAQELEQTLTEVLTTLLFR